MKVVVTSILKDEPEEFIARWVKSALDATELILVDTGSTNGCDVVARDHGVTVHRIDVQPWRFDAARNAALALVPADVDIVVKLDVDETLRDGWRGALEDAPPADRYSYGYIWDWLPDGTPNIAFTADHTITRHNWIWKHPVHEALHWLGEGRPVVVPGGFVIEHHADQNKSRGQYLPLLKRAVEEDPADDRMAHYYARELFFRNDWVAARREFIRHLSLPSAVWPAERAQSYRYLAKMDYFPERWLLHAIAEAPDRREPWVDLAQYYADKGEKAIAAGMAQRALMIRHRSGDYMSEASAWDEFALRKIVSDAYR